MRRGSTVRWAPCALFALLSAAPVSAQDVASALADNTAAKPSPSRPKNRPAGTRNVQTRQRSNSGRTASAADTTASSGRSRRGAGAPSQTVSTEQAAPEGEVRRAPSALAPSRDGELRSLGSQGWESAAGLHYVRRAEKELSLDSVLNHTDDQPAHAGTFGVFDGGRHGALTVIDQAYRRVLRGGTDVTVTERPGGQTVFTVNLGHRVGFIGGRAGAAEDKPEAQHVRLVLSGRDVVTAYPVRVREAASEVARAEEHAPSEENRAARSRQPGSVETAQGNAAQPVAPVRRPVAIAGLFRLQEDELAESPAGLLYSGIKPGAEHPHPVLAHLADDPNQREEHGVFDGDHRSAFGLIDEAYLRAESHLRETAARATRESAREAASSVQVREGRDAKGHYITYTVNMGRRVGYVGGRIGATTGNPSAEHIKLVVRGRELSNAYPVRLGSGHSADGPNRAQPGEHAAVMPPALAEALGRLGLPTQARPSEDSPNDYLIVNEDSRSVTSYNRDLMVPNWVAWTLEMSDLGPIGRSTEFHEDTRLPSSWPRPIQDALRYTPFDHGHLLPRLDRAANLREANATFVAGTNMVPQLAESNEGPWNSLEAELRRLVATEEKKIVVFSGPIFERNRPIQRLGGVAVPTALFKIAVVLDRDQRWRDVGSNTRVISVVVPNTLNSVRVTDSWAQFRVPSARVVTQARLPGLFQGLPATVRTALMNPHRVDHQRVSEQPSDGATNFRPRGFRDGRHFWSSEPIAAVTSPDQDSAQR